MRICIKENKLNVTILRDRGRKTMSKVKKNQNVSNRFYITQMDILTARKMSKYGVFSDPYFPVFGLNTDIYSINFRIQSQ